MTSRLGERMLSVAEELEAGASQPEPLGLWQAGARRRVRRRWAQGGAVVAALLVLGLVLAPSGVPTAVPAGRDGAGVTSYPARIGHQWFTPGFGPGQGPVAMLVERVSHRDSYDEPLGWEAVRRDGWRSGIQGANDYLPSLSPDGRWVGIPNGRVPGYRLVSTTTDRVWTFDEVPPTAIQIPSHWNARGDRVFVPGVGEGGGAVLGTDGSKQDVPAPPASQIYGWAGQDLVSLQPTKAAVGTSFAVMAWHPGGSWARTGTVISQPAFPADQGLDQWSASISPDGTRLALVVPVPGEQPAPTYLYDLPGGDPVSWSELGVSSASSGSGTVAMPHSDNVCPMAWQGEVPLGQFEGDSSGASDRGLSLTRPLPTGGAQPLTVSERRVGARCLVVAADALAGQGSWSLFGTQQNVVTWWWRELLAGLVLVAGAAVVLRRRVRGPVTVRRPGRSRTILES